MKPLINRLRPGSRFIKFGLVGASGVMVNIGSYWLMTRIFTLNELIANPVAIQVSIISNYILNERWTWRDRRSESLTHWLQRLLFFVFVSNLTAFGVQYLTFIILTQFFHVYDLLAVLVGIAIGTVFNYLVNHFWIFRAS